MTELNGSRRDIALALRDDWKTPHEVARDLGRPTGSLFGVLRRMHGDGLLKADSDPDPPTRGTQYRLSARGEAALDATLAIDANVGSLTENLRLVIVARKKLKPAAQVLASPVSAGVIAWAAELPDGWLLALEPGVDNYRVQTLLSAFEDARCRCWETSIQSLVNGQLLRSRAEALAVINH